MHVYLFQNLAAPRDHIDGNGLNNIASNIRSGTHGINARNLLIKCGVLDRGASFRVRWYNAAGKRMSRSFTKAHYDSEEHAREAAQECRDENAELAIHELVKMQSINPMPTPSIREFKPKAKLRTAEIQTNIRGLTYEKREMYGDSIRASITLGGKRARKTFALATYDGDYDKTIEAGQVWLEEMRSNHKRQKVDE
jgi:hypothetical protein